MDEMAATIFALRTFEPSQPRLQSEAQPLNPSLSSPEPYQAETRNPKTPI